MAMTKKLIIAALGCALLAPALTAPLAAQAPDLAAISAQGAAIKRLDWMNGRWKGPAVSRTPAGEHKVTQIERIGNGLDGTIKLLEGRGFGENGQLGFHALGIVSYDPSTQRYNLRSHAQGRAGDFPMTLTDSGYVWEIPIGPARIRYTATLTGGTWREIGERIAPGEKPQLFFEMNLTRIGDTDWPDAGGATAP
jgi:hypothetical protein